MDHQRLAQSTDRAIAAGPVLLLSVDYEDWHQLVRRRYGDPGWSEPGPALARQTQTILELFDELGVRCTFFILGVTARAHPDLVRRIAAAGHEIGSHGDAHAPVWRQTATEFADDLRRATATIEQLTGQRPRGYRAPAFSITSAAGWAYDVIAAEGFEYDASQSPAPSLRSASGSASRGPYERGAGVLWEFPVAASRWRSVCMPLGGASYWSVAPTRVVLAGLRRVPPLSGLYLHPQEFDPEPLDPLLGRANGAAGRARIRARTWQRNAARSRAVPVLRAIAKRHDLISYGEAHARLVQNRAAGARPLPFQGTPVR
jgi:polysaccharide deacetylase family protein (PEP-CTERM system associated)